MIHTLHLFAELDALLLDLLASLTADDWRRPTRAGAWTVHDVAGHLLDTALRRLTLVRDGWMRGDVTITSDADLLAFITRVNAEGVAVYGRLSPRLLSDFMAVAVRQLHAHLASIPLDAPAAFPVSWAGESSSPHWFDVAREYTERWHHQAQIREATGSLAPIMTARLYAPVLATFMYALPHALRHVLVADGADVRIEVDGEGGGVWQVTRQDGTWRLRGAAPREQPVASSLASVRMPADLAWRVLTKGARPDEIQARCEWHGDHAAAHAVLGARAIVG